MPFNSHLTSDLSILSDDMCKCVQMEHFNSACVCVQSTGDLAALRANEVAELVLALVRLKHDPGGNWMRGLLEHLETRSAACNRCVCLCQL